MKVLIVNQYGYMKGGAAKYAFYVRDILKDKGEHVSFFSGRHPKNIKNLYDEMLPEGLFPETLAAAPFLKKIRLIMRVPYNFDAARKLRALIKKIKPDIVHYHNIFKQLSASVLSVAEEEDVPSVWSLHDYNLFCAQGFLYRNGYGTCEECYGGRQYNAVRYRCYRNSFSASMLFALSIALASRLNIYKKIRRFTVPHEEMKERLVLWGLDRERIRVINNPYRIPERIDMQKKKYFIYMSSYNPSKGIDCLLQAVKDVDGVKLLLCGFGDGLDRVRERIVELGLEQKVEIIENVSWGGGLEKLVAEALCVISPSVAYNISEYVNLDAYAMQTAVLASRIGGNPFSVRDGKTGRLFKAGDSEELSKLMSWCAEHQEEIREMGKNGRRFLEQEYGGSRFYAELMSVYNDAAAG